MIMFGFYIWKIEIQPADWEEYESYTPRIVPEFGEEMSWGSREERYEKWVFEAIRKKCHWSSINDVFYRNILYKPFKEELSKIDAQWVKDLIKKAEESTNIDDIYFYFD